MEGWLGKSGGLSSYKEHYFCIKGNELIQLHRRETQGAKKSINLEKSKIVADKKDSRVFRLSVKGKQYLFRAPDEETCDKWLDSMKDLVKEADVSRQPISLRSLVSKQKVRYTEDGFNLDLTYITDHIIAMGYPATGAEAMYRNPLSKVKKMLSKKHPGRYKVYNLCSEKTYDSKTFKQFGHFPFSDHNTCPLLLIKAFCDDVHQWLEGGDDRVVAIHCKAGKGRAGMMISSYLIRAGLAESAEDALKMFGEKRCYDTKGVTIPSQMRSVKYYERYLKEYIQADRPFPYDATVELVHVRMVTVPNFDRNGGCSPYFVVEKYDDNDDLEETYDSQLHHEVRRHSKKEQKVELPCRVELQGDVKLTLMDKDTFGSNARMLSLWINAAFCPPRGKLVLAKGECDGTSKENKKNNFDRRFQIELYFGKRPADLLGLEQLSPMGSCSMQKSSSSLMRSLVSKKKVRFVRDKFDLDLTYITPNLIAMGWPSDGAEAMYRNPMSQVQKMLKRYHPARFKVYNLCAEREYKSECFGGPSSCATYGFYDHNACRLGLIREFCEDVDTFLEKGDGAHVAAVHCKAGKGRTGMMLSAYLLHSRQCETAEEALAFFADKRTADGKGVTIASQRRYVHYYERLLKEYIWEGKKLGPPVSKLLSKVTFGPVPDFDQISGGCLAYFLVLTPDMKEVFDSRKMSPPIHAKGKEHEIHVQTLLTGDCKLVFYHDTALGKDEKIMWFWFNTNMLKGNTLKLTKKEIDGASKKWRKVFHENFELELTMEPIKHLKMNASLKSAISRSARRRSISSSSSAILDSNGEPLNVKYLTENLLAVAYDHKNSVDVHRHGNFLMERHKGTHKMYNLEHEPIYDRKTWGGEQAKYPLRKLEPAPIDTIVKFCQDVDKYVHEEKGRVAVVFYQGSTGVMMSACYLLWDYKADNARAAIRRCQATFSINDKVFHLDKISPGQVQRINDFEIYLKMYKRVGKRFPFEGVSRTLNRIILHTLPRTKNGELCKPWLCVVKDGRQIVDYPYKKTADESEHRFRIRLTNCVLKGENKLVFKDANDNKTKFWIWIHTTFVPNTASRVYYEKSKVDEACRDASCQTFHEEFMVELWWDEDELS